MYTRCLPSGDMDGDEIAGDAANCSSGINPSVRAAGAVASATATQAARQVVPAMEPPVVMPGILADGGEGLGDVLDQVVDVFEADGKAHRAFGDGRLPQLLGGEIPPAHHLRRHDERLGGAETRGEREELQILGKPVADPHAALDVTRADGPEL